MNIFKKGKPANTGFKFNLGDKVKDQITEFTGVIIARTQWLNGCNTYSVKPQTLKDGVPQDSVGFDEPQLDLVEEEAAPSNRRTGGPEKHPAAPSR